MTEEGHPINVELLMETHESGRGRDVIHELATQLNALQREFYELKAGELSDELDASASDGGAQSEPPHFISRWSRWAGFA